MQPPDAGVTFTPDDVRLCFCDRRWCGTRRDLFGNEYAVGYAVP